MINSDLKFRANFIVNTQTLTLTDLIGSPAGSGYDALLSGYTEDHEQILGIFKAQSPAGVFYGGTAYNNNDFTAPDVQGLTDDWAESGISLPLAGASILCGLYTFSYKLLLALQGTLTSYATGGFNITGNDYSLLFGTTPVGMKIKIYSAGSPTGNEGVYDITAMSFGTGTTKVFASGVTPFTADADDRVAIIMETSNTFTYCFEEPTTDIETSSSCIFSTLTATDNSVYDFNFTGYGTKTPTTVRSWSLDCPAQYSASPVTAGNVTPLTIGYGTSYNSGADIWTGNYLVALTSTITYAVAEWGTGVYWVLVTDNIVSTKTHLVECDTCFCDIKQCVENLYVRYKEYLISKPSKALELGAKLFRVMAGWMLYGMEERCGGDYAQWCTEITEIVVGENCQCVTDTAISKEVVPLSLQISGGGCTCGITFGAGGAGFPANPVEGDTHFFNATGGGYNQYDVYFYTGGTWVYQFNIKGGQGIQGIQGIPGTGTSGADGTSVVFDNTLENPATLTGTSYAVFSGMTSGTLTHLATVGDKYIIKAAFETSAIGKTPDTVKVRIDGLTPKFTYLVSPFTALDIEHSFYGKVFAINVVAEATVIDVATKKLMVKYNVETLDLYANVLSTATIYSLITLSSALNAVVIDAQGKIGNSGTIKCRSLSVEFLNK